MNYAQVSHQFSANRPEQGVGGAEGQRRDERVGCEPEPRLRCESCISATQASVEAPLRSEPTGRSGEVATAESV